MQHAGVENWRRPWCGFSDILHLRLRGLEGKRGIFWIALWRPRPGELKIFRPAGLLPFRHAASF